MTGPLKGRSVFNSMTADPECVPSIVTAVDYRVHWSLRMYHEVWPAQAVAHCNGAITIRHPTALNAADFPRYTVEDLTGPPTQPQQTDSTKDEVPQ